MMSKEDVYAKRAELHKTEDRAKELRNEVNAWLYVNLEVNHLSMPSYDPGALLDELESALHCRNDRQLCTILRIPPPIISKLRTRKVSLSPGILLRMHDVSDIQINDLRRMAGIVPPVFK